MRKLNFLLTLLCMMSFGAIVAQSTYVLKGNPVSVKDPPSGLTYVMEKLDTSKVSFIATIRVKGAEGRATLQELYYTLRREANEVGANGLKKINYSERNNTLDGDFYFLSDTVLKENRDLMESNCVYVFGRERVSNKKLSFFLNDKKITLKGGEYFKYVIPEGQEIKIRSNTLFVSNFNKKWKAGGPPTFISLSGATLADPRPGAPATLTINTGGLTLIEYGLGYLLTQVLKPISSETSVAEKKE